MEHNVAQNVECWGRSKILTSANCPIQNLEKNHDFRTFKFLLKSLSKTLLKFAELWPSFWLKFFFLVQNPSPILYSIPMESVLGRLSLFPAGDTGTIPFESAAINWADCEALAERYCPSLAVLCVIRGSTLATVTVAYVACQCVCLNMVSLPVVNVLL